MNCHETRKYISAFNDNELDVRTNADVLDHVEVCRECAGRLEGERQLGDVVAAQVASVRAPEGLRARVEAMLREGSAGQGAEAGRSAIAGVWGLRARWGRLASREGFRVMTAAASIALVFVAAYMLLLSPERPLNAGIVGAHVAVVHDQMPTLFRTSDPDRAQRMAFSKMRCDAPVPLMNDADFTLIGAGPDQIELKDVGHFVFRYRETPVSLFIFQGLPLDALGGRESQAGVGLVKIDSARGMNIVAWDNSGFTCILVSRLATDDLLRNVAPRAK